jgi:acetyl esterase/lipase
VHAHTAELGLDADRIAIGGDSAGGNLAAVVAQLAPVPLRFQLLVYPVTDARAGSASYEENGDGYLLTAAAMDWFIEHYLSGGAGSRTDPRVSPLLGTDDAVAATPRPWSSRLASTRCATRACGTSTGSSPPASRPRRCTSPDRSMGSSA